MLENILLEMTETIRANLAQRQAEQDAFNQARQEQANTLDGLWESYRLEAQNTIQRLKTEAQEIEPLVSTVKQKLVPHLNALIRFMDTYHFYPEFEYEFSSKPNFRSSCSTYFQTQFFDHGATWENIELNIEKMQSDQDYRSASYTEKVDRVQQMIQSLSGIHASCQFGVQWGVDDPHQRHTIIGMQYEAGVAVYGVVIGVAYPHQITVNQTALDIERLDNPEYLCEALAAAFVEKPVSMGWIKTEEIKKKISEKETDEETAGFEPLLKTAWVQLKAYVQDTSFECSAQKASRSWFDHNLEGIPGEPALRLVELARSHGYEETLLTLMNRLPAQRYFPVMDRFYPRQDHLKTAVDSFTQGIQSKSGSIQFLTYAPEDWEYIREISSKLTSIGRLMGELHQCRLLGVEQFCAVIHGLNEAIQKKEEQPLSADSAISRLFFEWLSRLDDLEMLDRVVSTWKLLQPDLCGRMLRLKLLQTRDEAERARVRNALVCCGGSEALLAAMLTQPWIE